MAASSSLSVTLSLLPLYNPSASPKSKPSLSFSLQSSKSLASIRSRAPPSVVAAAPGTLESPSGTADGLEIPKGFEVEEKSEGSGPSLLAVGDDAEKMAPKQKIRIKLRSYWVPLIEDSCKQILEAARTTNAKTMGPVPLPTKRRVYCVLKSPHVHKDARFHFEIRTHQRLIDILHPTAQTIDSLMQLDLPAGVDVEVKL
ncbi:small ribosomal subunit protein uS10c [Elaeis guineensis]|uniref:Small ribosomal subunit protein uS10c n=1 Tax=Elaeis guineensis var. tenera TaxID=51953 RepID=A0A6I9Q9U4_ELAGV|nr:30S ribosomal protein S10, chloroplastic [Elaeis guineensis]